MPRPVQFENGQLASPLRATSHLSPTANPTKAFATGVSLLIMPRFGLDALDDGNESLVFRGIDKGVAHGIPTSTRGTASVAVQRGSTPSGARRSDCTTLGCATRRVWGRWAEDGAAGCGAGCVRGLQPFSSGSGVAVSSVAASPTSRYSTISLRSSSAAPTGAICRCFKVRKRSAAHASASRMKLDPQQRQKVQPALERALAVQVFQPHIGCVVLVAIAFDREPASGVTFDDKIDSIAAGRHLRSDAIARRI